MTAATSLGARWLDFAGTLRRHGRGDQLVDPAALDEWLARAGLTAGQPATETDLSAGLELREALVELALAVASDTRPDGGAARKVNIAVAHDEPPTLRLAGGALRSTAPMTTRIGLGRVARDAVDYLSAGHSPRLRVCAGVGCSTVFADRSGRRRFCPR